MNVNSIVDIKTQHLMRVVGVLKAEDGLLKKEIGERTGLSIATVSNLCRELRELGLIAEEDAGDARDAAVGRQPKAVRFCPGRFYIVCLDMHRSDEMRLVLLNLANELVAERRFALAPENDLPGFLAKVKRLCLECCAASGVDYADIIGIGAAVPAIFDTGTERTVSSGIRLFENVPLKAMLESTFGVPVFIDNESNLCAVSVHKNAFPSQNLFYVFCSEGLGVGVVAGGRLISGHMGYAPEVCHIPIGDPSLTCGLCGQTGCVQTDLCISGFVSKHRGVQVPSDDPAVKRGWQEFLEAVERGEAGALRVVEQNAALFGQLLSILVNVFDPEYVLLGGDVLPLFERLLPAMEREIAGRRIGNGRPLPRILPDRDPDTIAIGCAEQVFKSALPIRTKRKAV